MQTSKATGRATAPSHDRPRGKAALLIVDMINCFDFPGADRLRPKAQRVAERIGALRTAFERAGAPVIYVNDNFGEWHSERSRLVERAAQAAEAIVARLAPAPDDYFIIKPQFSGFYATNLPVLLPKLGVSRLVLTGIQTDICVLFTAADAHMRDYALWVPEDAVAAEDERRGGGALAILRDIMGAETQASASLSLEDWMRRLDDEAR